MILSFHGHSDWNRHWINNRLYSFRANHMTWLDLSWFRDNVLIRWGFSSVLYILTVLSFSGWHFVLISTMISHNLLRHLGPSFLSPALAFLCMLRHLLDHDKFLANWAWLGSTSTSLLVFLNFYKSISILAILTIYGFSRTDLMMGFKNTRREGLITHMTLFIGVLFSLRHKICT